MRRKTSCPLRSTKKSARIWGKGEGKLVNMYKGDLESALTGEKRKKNWVSITPRGTWHER